MMQAWADYLGALRGEGSAIAAGMNRVVEAVRPRDYD